MKTLLTFGLLLLLSATTLAHERRFEGEWRTTNRRLDGTMTCVVTELGNAKWKGRFSGVWNGVPFDYTVPFDGPPSDLRGTAVIDGANYYWSGAMRTQSPGWFKGTFDGSRYTGNFHLQEK